MANQLSCLRQTPDRGICSRRARIEFQGVMWVLFPAPNKAKIHKVHNNALYCSELRCVFRINEDQDSPMKSDPRTYFFSEKLFSLGC